MCSVAVGLCLMHLSVSAWADWQALQRLHRAAWDTQQVWRQARDMARRSPHHLRLDLLTSPTSCWVLHTGRRGDCDCSASACAGGAERWLAVPLHTQGLRLDSHSTGWQWDRWQGTVTPTASVTWSLPDGRAVQHSLNLMGRVRSCAPQGLVAGYPAC